MRALLFATLLVGVVFSSSAAHAEEPTPTTMPDPNRPVPTPPPPPAAPPPVAPGALAASSPVAASQGYAVLAVGDSASSSWPLARALYGRPALRPSGVDEAHARVLAGEAPRVGASRELQDLAETRAAVHGDDAPSRQLLTSIGTSLHVRGIVVVMSSPGGSPQARVFLVDAAAFDAARYAPDTVDAGETEWTGAVASLDRAYGGGLAPAPTPAASSAPALATQAMPPPKDSVATKEKDSGGSKPFYASAWFWGAVGAAALGGTALYFATRDNTSSTIHLSLQVPR